MIFLSGKFIYVFSSSQVLFLACCRLPFPYPIFTATQSRTRGSKRDEDSLAHFLLDHKLFIASSHSVHFFHFLHLRLREIVNFFCLFPSQSLYPPKLNLVIVHCRQPAASVLGYLDFVELLFMLSSRCFTVVHLLFHILTSMFVWFSFPKQNKKLMEILSSSSSSHIHTRHHIGIEFKLSLLKLPTFLRRRKKNSNCFLCCRLQM